jgi:hypothetical protein
VCCSSGTVEAGIPVSNTARGAGIVMCHHHSTERGSEHNVSAVLRIPMVFMSFFIFGKSAGLFLAVLCTLLAYCR